MTIDDVEYTIRLLFSIVSGIGLLLISLSLTILVVVALAKRIIAMFPLREPEHKAYQYTKSQKFSERD